MDEIDHKLMSLLRQDARLTVAALAAKLQVSRGTVTNRIRRLEDDGGHQAPLASRCRAFASA